MACYITKNYNVPPKENNNLLFTVFTPTYNRKDTIHRVYNSLIHQTFANFEWVIIDDGSEDGTYELIKGWQQEGFLNIVYEWQHNQGKHIAINRATQIAKGEFFIIADSDDGLIATALEKLKFYWDKIDQNDKKKIAGIFFLCIDQNRKLVGNKFPNDFEISDLAGMNIVKGIGGEKGALIQTKVMRMYPFPENIKNVVVGEGSLWYRMAKDWMMCFINEPLRIFWIENRPDSLSLLSVKPQNYLGAHYVHLCFLNYNMRFFTKRPKLFAGEATRYAKLSFHLKKGLTEQLTQLKPFSAKVLWVLFMPLGFAFYLKDKQKKES